MAGHAEHHGVPTPPRTRARSRHGHGARGSVTGPHLPPLRTRVEDFEAGVAASAEYLRDLWPDELSDVSFEIAGMPSEEGDGPEVRRWLVLPVERRIILYRLPIERLAKVHRVDDLHKRMLVESSVFRAVAELLGKDPWELAPDRFRHL